MYHGLEKYTYRQLIAELRSRPEVWAVKVWLRDDVEDWLNTNLGKYDNKDHDLEARYEEIIEVALIGTADLDEPTEADWWSIDSYMGELLKADFGARLKEQK